MAPSYFRVLNMKINEAFDVCETVPILLSEPYARERQPSQRALADGQHCRRLFRAKQVHQGIPPLEALATRRITAWPQLELS